MSRHLVVVGGGVIGLSIAWQAATENLRVTLIDRGPLGHEASWASAGMLPYVNPDTASHPLEKLAGWSYLLHAQWYPEIVATSGIDYEYEVTGTVHIARSRAEQASLKGIEQRCREESIPFQWLAEDELYREIPAVADIAESTLAMGAIKLPADARLRPPRFTQALAQACRRRGVEIIADAGIVRLQSDDNRVRAAESDSIGRVVGDEFVVAAGTWSAELLAPLGVFLKIVPIRGQIAYFQLAKRPFIPAVYEGGNYLVPRRDGGLLAGSTLEDVGFDKSNTSEAIETLSRFARGILPELSSRRPDLVWAGLRPATFDGFPYIGAVPSFENLLVAAGHFRNGIHLAPATAVAICRILSDQPEVINMFPFRTSRD